MNFLRRFGPVGFIAVHVEILVLCGTLLAAFGVQFFEGEMPCPLCILQRLAMMISAMGTAFIVVRWKEGRLAQADYMTGHGMIYSRLWPVLQSQLATSCCTFRLRIRATAALFLDCTSTLGR